MKDASFTYFVVGDYPLNESCPLCGGEVQWRVIDGTSRLQCAGCGELLVQNDCPQDLSAALRKAQAIIRSNREAGEFAQGYGNLRATKYLTAGQEAEQRLFDTILYFGGSLERMIELYKAYGRMDTALLAYATELPATKYMQTIETYGEGYVQSALDRYGIVKGYLSERLEALPYSVIYKPTPPPAFRVVERKSTPRRKPRSKALHSASKRLFRKRR